MQINTFAKTRMQLQVNPHKPVNAFLMSRANKMKFQAPRPKRKNEESKDGFSKVSTLTP